METHSYRHNAATPPTPFTPPTPALRNAPTACSRRCWGAIGRTHLPARALHWPSNAATCPRAGGSSPVRTLRGACLRATSVLEESTRAVGGDRSPHTLGARHGSRRLTPPRHTVTDAWGHAKVVPGWNRQRTHIRNVIILLASPLTTGTGASPRVKVVCYREAVRGAFPGVSRGSTR